MKQRSKKIIISGNQIFMVAILVAGLIVGAYYIGLNNVNVPTEIPGGLTDPKPTIEWSSQIGACNEFGVEMLGDRINVESCEWIKDKTKFGGRCICYITD